ncbi:helix-turn-helix domain-containing protein [Aneurinibacillus tyrosinisolvens]|uniref:helix-turn-helix domain-containing protein n=1 Tax=Aneurinibacillus tyrosinisolvens TaxID=1443435 RepID=UPI00063F8916
MDRIKNLRKKNGDTLKQLATKIDYDYSNLSKVERGIYRPSLELLQKISAVYNVDIKTLLQEEYEYSSIEHDFLEDLEITSEDLKIKYSIMLDGERLTKEELGFIINMIRNLRTTVKKTKKIEHILYTSIK